MITKTVGDYSTVYKLHDEVHRSDGPAICWNDGDFMWCLHGLKHRYYGSYCNYSNSGMWRIHGVMVKDG